MRCLTPLRVGEHDEPVDRRSADFADGPTTSECAFCAPPHTAIRCRSCVLAAYSVTSGHTDPSSFAVPGPSEGPRRPIHATWNPVKSKVAVPAGPVCSSVPPQAAGSAIEVHSGEKEAAGSSAPVTVNGRPVLGAPTMPSQVTLLAWSW